ncbi:GntR family transcriptional regulator [Alkalibacter saccharofermentans]|uniref:DNA-binding transcriptional regulator, GntR family n=1 Tax=Alkalibacter saccharofermentans DSM 14828 TaxID=1120975 RepID=A0A1M4YNK0_9FIRM|nr:GntR family transcriptional regulator [Alkalibacter saccharofermentans]SHF07360.1 DNA-binding transcriptional regulator, GntR family [Alkalibacter saccharofermentans DSM 14828]
MDNFLKIDMDTYKPLREIVFTTMREAIINGDFKPGQRLMEVQLAEQMGVSRTPVREAIRKLELEGLVVMVPRKGAYVAGLSSEDVKEVLEIRAVLEGLAASLAAKNASAADIEQLQEIVEKFKVAAEEKDVVRLINFDSDFHDVMYRASKNKKLIQLISALREQVQRFRVAYFTKIRSTQTLIEEHNDLVSSIVNNEPDRARAIAEKHISTTEKLITSIEEKR